MRDGAYNDGNHASLVLLSNPIGSKKEDGDGDGDGGNGKVEFHVAGMLNDDEELDCEAEKQEEVEF